MIFLCRDLMMQYLICRDKQKQGNYQQGFLLQGYYLQGFNDVGKISNSRMFTIIFYDFDKNKLFVFFHQIAIKQLNCIVFCVATPTQFPPLWKPLATLAVEIVTPVFRFGSSVQLLCSACFMFQMLVYMAIVVYAPALALTQVIKLHKHFLKSQKMSTN